MKGVGWFPVIAIPATAHCASPESGCLNFRQLLPPDYSDAISFIRILPSINQARHQGLVPGKTGGFFPGTHVVTRQRSSGFDLHHLQGAAGFKDQIGFESVEMFQGSEPGATAGHPAPHRSRRNSRTNLRRSVPPPTRPGSRHARSSHPAFPPFLPESLPGTTARGASCQLCLPATG